MGTGILISDAIFCAITIGSSRCAFMKRSAVCGCKFCKNCYGQDKSNKYNDTWSEYSFRKKYKAR